jgi:hypothetical protein
MVKRRGQRWRQLVVWLHVITSVGWMGQAVTLVSLLAVSLTDPGNAVAATTMARHLDIGLLAPLANASAFTGCCSQPPLHGACSGTGGWPRSSRSR